MRRKITLLIALTTLSILAVVTTACGSLNTQDEANAKITQIAQTVQAQLTANSLLTPSATATSNATATPSPIPATATPSGPTSTPTKTPYPTYAAGSTQGDHSIFVKDITIPDGTVFTTGTEFTKTWLFTNTGTTTWSTNYKLVYLEGNATDKNNVLSVNLPNSVAPGESVEVSVVFAAPAAKGTYTSWWQLFSADGKFFGDSCSIVFSVGDVASTSVPTTATSATATASTTLTVTATP
jgi:hypothetical protein